MATICYHPRVIEYLEKIAIASVAMTARALAETAGSELTFLGWRTLVVVGGAGAPIRLSDLAGRLGVSRPSASKLVRRMIRRGLLELSADPTDRRGIRLRLSPEGARLRDGVIERRRQLIAESVDGVALADSAGGDATLTLELAAGRLSKWT
jgi:DNA-binding MarR family transcriptional regulator